jgi:hypothetical protein
MSGLSINPVSSYYVPSYTQSATNSAQTNFQNLSLALQSGNVAAARSAFAALQKTFQGQTSLTQTSGTSNAIGGFNSLAQALDSGDLAASQAAFADLQQDLSMEAQSVKQASVARVQHSNQ